MPEVAVPPSKSRAKVRRRKASGKTFHEFFAGMGLVREGLASGGWECVYANDIDRQKAELYRAALLPAGSEHAHA
jgi:hypothetical protein